MKKESSWLPRVLLLLIAVILLVELFRDAAKDGDFIGYVNAGNAVLSGEKIYNDFLNTWPPFFSVFCVPLALGDSLSSYGIRFAWLLGSIGSMLAAVALTVRLITKKTLGWKEAPGQMSVQNMLLLIPLLIVMRFVMDNLANLQVNTYILLGVVVAMWCFSREKYALAGLLLGFTISLKVYPIFFLFFFLFKREFRMVGWTLLFVAAFSLIPFFVFGWYWGEFFYHEWLTKISPKSFIAQHKSQSLFSMLLRFFTTESTGLSIKANLFAFDPALVKRATYLLVVLGAIFPAFLLRKKLTDKQGPQALLEYSMVFTLIPILSPVAWKPYFIFLFVPWFLVYLILFRLETRLSKKRFRFLKILFFLSIVLNIGSSEFFVGPWLSDVLELYSSITFGSLLLLLAQILIIMDIDKVDFYSRNVLLANPFLKTS